MPGTEPEPLEQLKSILDKYSLGTFTDLVLSMLGINCPNEEEKLPDIDSLEQAKGLFLFKTGFSLDTFISSREDQEMIWQCCSKLKEAKNKN